MARRVKVRRGNVIVTTTRPRPSDKIISTPTERRLQQSLPAGIRDRPVEEVRAGQTIRGGQTRPSSSGKGKTSTTRSPHFKAPSPVKVIKKRTPKASSKLKSAQKQFRLRKAKLEAGIRRDDERRLKLRGETFQTRITPESKKKKFKRGLEKAKLSATAGVGKTILGVVALGGLGVRGVKASVRNVRELPNESKKLVKQIRKDPSSIKKMTANEKRKLVTKIKKTPQNAKKFGEKAKQSGKKALDIIRYSPSEAIAFVGTEAVLLAGTGGSLKVVGKVTRPATKSIKSVSAKGTAKIVQTAKGTKVTGKTIKVKTKTARGKPKRTVTIKKVKTTKRESIGKQLGVKKGEFLPVSAQADKLVKNIRRRKVIRKPLPNEGKLSKRNKQLLKKFDQGKINKRELNELQRNVPLLERSFFADPKGRLRTGRLGVDDTKDASLRDIIRGNFRVRGQKPQVLVFPDAKIPKFPKGFSTIERKLKSGKALTKAESDKLLNFQLKRTGKFKPLGFVSRESEVTLAPNEVIKKVKTLTRIEANGKLVPIVQAKVVKVTPKTKKLLEKSRKGKITKVERAELKRRIKKESGGLQTASSRSSRAKPRLRSTRKISATALSRKRSPSKRPRKRPTPRRTPSRKSPSRSPPRSPPRRSPPRSPKSPPKRPPRSPPRSPPKTPKTKPPIKPKAVPIPRKKKKGTIVRKTKGGYNVYGRPLKASKGSKRPKLIKINKVPLTKARAEDYRNYLLDTSLARTGSIRKTGKKAKRGKLRVPVGYGKRTSVKFRKNRIVKGKARSLKKGKVIERSKRLLDTKQEKKKITLRRRIKQITPKKVKRRSKK